MRIGLTSPALARAKGGIERFSIRLGSWLADNGHEVHFFHYPLDGPGKILFSAHPAARLHALSTNPGDNLEIIKQLDLDALVLTNDGCDRSYLYPCLTKLDIPTIYSEHAPPWNLENEAWNHVSRVATVAYATVVHFHWLSAAESIPAYLHYKISSIPNCVTVPERVTPLKGRSKTILSVARLAESDKQLSHLIKAFALVAEKFPDWKLRICGEGDHRQKYEELIKTCGLETRIELPGNRENIDAEYEDAQIFALSSRYECCPISLLEAQSHGLPLVGYATCYGVGEIIEHGENGFLASEMTPESFAIALETALANEDDRVRMSASSLKRAINFSPQLIYPRFFKLIEKACQEKGTHPQGMAAQDLKKIAYAKKYFCKENRLGTESIPSPTPGVSMANRLRERFMKRSCPDKLEKFDFAEL